jgi:hypothetical protein
MDQQSGERFISMMSLDVSVTRDGSTNWSSKACNALSRQNSATYAFSDFADSSAKATSLASAISS